jgi:hypothetical protein
LAYKRISPQPVVEGGTGAQTLGLNGVLIGNTLSAITATVAGTTGQVLTGVTGSAPTFQSPAASSITITGDSGGGLTGSSFTITGGTTGLTFAGAGSTETLGGTLKVANGGTGNTTFTAYSLIAAGTTATGAFQNVVGVGTSGQILVSAGASALPVWTTAAATTISITGDSGGALTSGSFTFTGGTTGLTFAGAGTTETLGGTLAVKNGGTGAATLTGVLIGNGTSAVTGNAVTQYDVLVGGASNAISSVGPGAIYTILQSGGAGANPAYSTSTYPSTTTINQILYAFANNDVAGITAANNGVLISGSDGAPSWLADGTTGKVLTATTGSPPSWASPASSSITITGDTGGGLTGNSFTFAGGTTGLSFGGSGTTETLTFAGITANGGTVSLATDATTSTINIGTGAGAKTTTLGSTNTTSSTIIKSGSGNIVANSGLTVDSTGRMTNSVQPAFLAWASSVSNVTGNGATYTILFNNVVFDQNSNFTGASGTFTAPKTGIYNLSVQIAISGLLVAHNNAYFNLVTTSASYLFYNCNPYAISNSGSAGLVGSVTVNMTAGNTATVALYVASGTKVINIIGNTSTDIRTSFSGNLVA